MTVDLAQIVAIGGPSSAISVVIYMLVNAFLSARKDRREQQASDVQNDTGIIDNAKRVVELARLEMERLEERVVALSQENKDLRERVRRQESHIQEQGDRLARQDRALEWLRRDLEKATQEIQELRNRNGPAQ